ncbi:MAG: EamA/RhaT family transporter, partial [Rhodobacteraceae bacterium]|nr:EamA/RhaT family transporter [Paracoccaceae bacterium]
YIIGALAVSPFANFESYSITQAGLLLLNGALIIPLAIGLLSIGPRYLPAAEVSMFSVLEVIFAPLLVWIVLGENPGGRSIFGGIVILTAIFAHTFWRLKYNKE